MKLVAAVLFVLLLAGCGGGSKHYRASEVRACLKDQGRSLKGADIPGDVAPDGSEGNLAVHVSDTEVDLAFGKDSDEARTMEREEEALASVALGTDAGDYVRTKNNVAYWVTSTDTTAFGPVEDCLK